MEDDFFRSSENSKMEIELLLAVNLSRAVRHDLTVEWNWEFLDDMEPQNFKQMQHVVSFLTTERFSLTIIS